MLTFSNLGKYGRLGNQMFQIAATIGISKNNYLDYIFPHWYCNYTNKDYTVFFKNKLPIGKITTQKTIRENFFHYTDIKVIDKKENTDLFGYFQSEKYFVNYRNLILQYFTPTDDLYKKIYDQYGMILENTCSIHIRRGDYLNLQHIHPVLTKEYYIKAIDELYGNEKKNIKFIFFSDDILWCKQNFDFGNSIFIDSNDEIFDIFLMSKCENNIISNSSFSWWGAWLNQRYDKKVVAPKKWFGNNVKNNTRDLYPNDWILL